MLGYMVQDPWHFARSELAASTLALLTQGPAKALALFGPRRTGKTEFLLKDLGPFAESRGHRVVYISFWQAPLSPVAVMLHALDLARRRLSFTERVRSGLVNLPAKLELSLPGAPVKASIDLSSLRGPASSDLLLHLDDRLGAIAKTKKPTLLLLDEFQELGLSADHAPLVAALRTSLDKRRDSLAAIFTGSSREGLQTMFSSRQAAFFQFATPLDLPRLDERFVDHLLSAFKQATTRQLPRDAMIDAFAQLHHNPAYFRWLIETLMARRDMSVAAALDDLKERLAIDLKYPQTWAGLKPIHRAVAVALAMGTEKPYGEETRAQIGKLMGTAPPAIPAVQAALRKLARDRIVDRWADSWLIDDPEFAVWMQSQVGRDGRL
jgi:uncharacterized protein